jgi:hypothetical protein
LQIIKRFKKEKDFPSSYLATGRNPAGIRVRPSWPLLSPPPFLFFTWPNPVPASSLTRGPRRGPVKPVAPASDDETEFELKLEMPLGKISPISNPRQKQHQVLIEKRVGLESAPFTSTRMEMSYPVPRKRERSLHTCAQDVQITRIVTI